MLSLNARLILAASIVLALFFGLTGFTLDSAYTHSAETALKDRLQGRVNVLVAASELGEDGVARLTNALPEVRFFNPGSDLYAYFVGNNNRHAWRSPSLGSLDIRFPSGLARGETAYQKLKATDGTVLQIYSLGVTWDDSPGPRGGYTFSVAENVRNIQEQISGFRRILWGWLTAVAVILLAVQGSIMRWSLKPLRRVADDLAAIEHGKQTELQGRYPAELLPLTDNINALIRSSRELLERYRHSLGDLAHSLKTPLALLRGAVEGHKAADELLEIVPEQVDRMSRTVDYQLQRAAASGGSTLVAPINVAQVARKVAAALNKVYSDKAVICHLHVDEECEFHGDEGDLFEILGNLLDNAFKWCRHRVEVRAAMDSVSTGLTLSVEDDGPGISPDVAQEVRRRGVSIGGAESGHGIGLAIVDDIIRIYGGTLEVITGTLGGALMKVHLPNR